MRKPNPLYVNQLKQVYAAIEAAETGGPAAVQLRGRSWSTIEDLYRLAELVRLDAAIAAIEEGAQSYTIDDHSFSRAQYKDLCDRRDMLTRQTAVTARGGIRVRQGVPIV